MHGALSNASLARIPGDALVRLGALRTHPGVEVRVEQGRAWVRWNEPGTEVLRALLPVESAAFFERVGERWHLCGRSLPYFEIPRDGFRPLASVLSLGAASLIPCDDEPPPKVVLALKRSTPERPATALLCTAKSLAAWAEMAPGPDLERLYAARSGELVLVTGAPLPALANTERYWGDRLLCPLGWAPDPALPESALIEALGVGDNELALIRNNAVEVIPRDVLQPLSRASARLGAS